MNILKVRNILNIIFMVLAVISIICYFAIDHRTFFYVCIAAIFVKVVEFFIRFMF